MNGVGDAIAGDGSGFSNLLVLVDQPTVRSRTDRTLNHNCMH